MGLVERVEDRLLEREDEHGRVGRSEALKRTLARNFGQRLLQRSERRLSLATVGEACHHSGQHRLGLASEFAFPDAAGHHAVAGLQALDPSADQRGPMAREDSAQCLLAFGVRHVGSYARVEASILGLEDAKNVCQRAEATRRSMVLEGRYERSASETPPA